MGLRIVRTLGVDFGDSRTGVAVSDPMGWTARGAEVVRGGINRAAEGVARLAAQYGTGVIVVGYPLNMNGTAGARAERTDTFIRKLSAIIENTAAEGAAPVKIVRWDERLTSVEASKILKETGFKPASRGEREKGGVDLLSAEIILQSYLDRSAIKPEGETHERGER